MTDAELAGAGALFVGGDDQADPDGRGHEDALHVQKPCGMAHRLAGRPVVAIDVVVFEPTASRASEVVRSRTDRSVASMACSR